MAAPLTEQYNELELIEVESLLAVIYRRYGYDFREYSQASVIRRLIWRKQQWKLSHIAEMIPLVLHSDKHFHTLLADMSISVTEMFRDPPFFDALVKQVFPVLRTFPFFKIWHAGCATGEEVYSLAILLHEHGLYDRAQIYATDFNTTALATAREGIYSTDKIDDALKRYHLSGGQADLTDYFHSGYGNSIAHDMLKKRITFAVHNLVVDRVFGEMELVICRNVMIYFNTDLKKQVINLFHSSLYHSGFLCLGDKESLNQSVDDDRFKLFNDKAKIYQKTTRYEQGSASIFS